jgi:predicted PurR-regulated permease PerM
MEFLRQDEEREVDECGTGRKRESVLTRFLRKKYKCIMMFLCIVALTLQTIYLIVEKTDSENINTIMNKLPNITKKMMKFLKSFDLNQTDQVLSLHTSQSSTQSEGLGMAEYG